MVPLSNSAASDNPELSASSTGTAADGGWRARWQAEAIRQGSDWPSIIAAHLTIGNLEQSPLSAMSVLAERAVAALVPR